MPRNAAAVSVVKNVLPVPALALDALEREIGRALRHVAVQVAEGSATRVQIGKADIDRVVEIWTECLATYGGPFLFGRKHTMADAMYAPVVTRFLTYDVKLNKPCADYCRTIMAMPEMKEWVAAAKREPEEIEELDMEF